jgi:CRP-like cAMP-binding protein
MDTATYSAERRPLLWDAPVAFLLWSLEEAKVRIAERRYEAGKTIYSRGEPDRYLYFLTKGVLKIYKSYGGHKEAIVALLEESNASVCLTCGHAALTATRPRPLSGLGSPP